MRGLRLAALASAAVAGCTIDVDYTGTGFRCVEDPTCPPGLMCVAGMCQVDPAPAIDAGADAGDTQTITISVVATEDDAEEILGTNQITLTSISLEMAEGDDEGLQRIAIRFADVGIPVGADVVAATIQFVVQEATVDPAALVIEAQATADAPPVADVVADISSRPTTTEAVTWTVPAWPTLGEGAADQRTVDLSPVIEEVIALPGWAPGNSIVILLSGTGRRVANSFDSNAQPPALTIEYALP